MQRIASSLVTRMFVAAAAFSALIFVVVGALEVWRERVQLTEAARSASDSALTLSSGPIALALWNYDTTALDLLGRNLSHDGAIVRVEVLAEDGTRVMDLKREGHDLPKATQVRELELMAPARTREGVKRIGRLRVSESFDAIDAQIMRRTLARLPLELVKVLAISLGILLLLHRMVTQRLSTLVEQLRSIKLDDPSARVLITGGDKGGSDEIVELATAVNKFQHDRALEMARRREAEQRLLEGLQERSVILSSLRDGVLALDEQQQIRFANAAAARLLGSKNLQGQSLAGLARVQAATTAANSAASSDLTEWLNSHRAPEQRQYMQRLRLLPRDAPAFDALLQANTLLGAPEVAAILVISDISEEVRGLAADRARERAEASNRAKSDFLSRMSHELRTPLNAIVGFAQSLERDPVLREDPQRLERIQLITRAGWHLAGMIGDVLELSRIESGQVKLTPGPVDLPALISDAMAFVSADAQREGVTLALHAPADLSLTLGYAQADPMRLEQVLVNLLSNAVKYNRPGGRVDVSVMAGAPATVEIRVRDTGLGLSTQQLANLYQSFNRLGREDSGKAGTGIGLVVTRTLVELMQGQISVSSAPGVGTEFCVTLPLSSDTPLQPLPLPELQSAYGPKQVLYIEDDPVNATVMQALLSKRPSIALQICTSVREGLAALRQAAPDLLLLDMQLPDGSGLDVLQALEREQLAPGLPVLMVSADVMDESVGAALSAGARSYITKPLDFEQVLSEVDGLLREAPPVT
nr:ATP-binding protein [uncultured Roseateles sp.]